MAKIQYLGWDAFQLTSNRGVRILLDPFLSGYPEHHLPPSPVRPADLTPDFIAVTHGSRDHIGDTFEIMRNTDAKLLCGIDVRLHATRQGFAEERTVLMVSGCKFEYEDILVRALDARHISWTMLDGHPVTGPAMCYIVKLKDGPTIFFGGDTSITYDLKLYGELYRPDIAMIGVAGALINGRTVEELDPHEAAIAAEFLGVQKAIPMHYRESEPPQLFKQNFESRVPGGEGIIMTPGQELIF